MTTKKVSVNDILPAMRGVWNILSVTLSRLAYAVKAILNRTLWVATALTHVNGRDYLRTDNGVRGSPSNRIVALIYGNYVFHLQHRQSGRYEPRVRSRYDF